MQSSTIVYQYLIVQYTIVLQGTIAIPLNMCDSIENINCHQIYECKKKYHFDTAWVSLEYKNGKFNN